MFYFLVTFFVTFFLAAALVGFATLAVLALGLLDLDSAVTWRDNFCTRSDNLLTSSAVMTVTAEGGEDGDPQDVEASLMMKIYMWGGNPGILASELRLLAHEVKQQIDWHDGRWGGPRLNWQNTRFQGWLEGEEGQETQDFHFGFVAQGQCAVGQLVVDKGNNTRVRLEEMRGDDAHEPTNENDSPRRRQQPSRSPE